MSKKGGYKIIDFKNTPLTIVGGKTETIPGIYDSIKRSYRKPLLLSGLIIDNIEFNDAYASYTIAGKNFTFNVYGRIITITDADVVSVK